MDQRLTMADIAKRMKVTRQAVSLMLRGETLAPYRWAQMREMEIPEDLLPREEYSAPGPKPKADSMAEA